MCFVQKHVLIVKVFWGRISDSGSEGDFRNAEIAEVAQIAETMLGNLE